MLPMMDVWLADMVAQSGDCDAALSIIERSLAGLNDVTGRSWEAELHRQKAETLISLGPNREPEAEAALTRAIDFARHQDAKSLELRAASSLAALWRSHGRHQDAVSLIAPVYDWFSEGQDTRDIARARDIRLSGSAIAH
jgi:predicted ATPase